MQRKKNEQTRSEPAEGRVNPTRRSPKANPRRATAALEDSRTRPSRKSTRASTNRGKPSQGKERTALARAVAPSARSQRRGG